MAMTIVEATRTVVGGIDTHGEVHVAAVLDELGAHLGTESFSADAPGYEALLHWLEDFGPVAKVGVEGTGSYGAGISRFLALSGICVIEAGTHGGRAGASCAGCPVREDCLAFALEHEDLVGVWGGTTAEERREMRRSVA
jgi:hypothetical protein